MGLLQRVCYKLRSCEQASRTKQNQAKQSTISLFPRDFFVYFLLVCFFGLNDICPLHRNHKLNKLKTENTKAMRLFECYLFVSLFPRCFCLFVCLVFFFCICYVSFIVSLLKLFVRHTFVFRFQLYANELTAYEPQACW